MAIMMEFVGNKIDLNLTKNIYACSEKSYLIKIKE